MFSQNQANIQEIVIVHSVLRVPFLLAKAVSSNVLDCINVNVTHLIRHAFSDEDSTGGMQLEYSNV